MTKSNVSSCFSIVRACFLRARSGAQVQFRARKIGRDEVNCSGPGTRFLANRDLSFLIKEK